MSGFDHSRAQTSFEPRVLAPDYEVSVEYLGRLEIAVSGKFTGKLYRFSPFRSVQPVDPRDAFHLLACGLFGVSS